MGLHFFLSLVSWNPGDLCKSCSVARRTPWGLRTNSCSSPLPTLPQEGPYGTESSLLIAPDFRVLHSLYPAPFWFLLSGSHMVCASSLLQETLLLPSIPLFLCAPMSPAHIAGKLSHPVRSSSSVGHPSWNVPQRFWPLESRWRLWFVSFIWSYWCLVLRTGCSLSVFSSRAEKVSPESTVSCHFVLIPGILPCM